VDDLAITRVDEGHLAWWPTAAAKAVILGETEGFAKVIADATTERYWTCT
jgi:pyruvate/2-oxoglutarate dehydrogenase complex dihydrolipoamide dehydrogenase (E3) component